MSERAKHAVAAAVILATALAVFGPALARREVFMFRDHSDYFQPLRLFTAQHLRVGRIPLWNPYNGSGEPWLANPQTAIFYPPAWLFVILPFSTAYVGYLFLHSLLLGGGAYLLFRRNAAPLAAVGGAMALMLSGPILSMLDVSNNFTTFAWLPLLMWCALEDRHFAAALILAMSFLAGEPLLAAVAALIYTVIVRRVRTIALTGVIAAALSAVQLIPFVEMVVKSNRVKVFEPSEVLQSSMSFHDWMRMFISPRLRAIAPPPGEEFIFVVYVSTFIALLAVAGCVVLVIERRWRSLGGWLALLMIAASIACGPPWIARFPIELFRYPARFVPYVAFALIALAVAAWNRVAGKSIVIGVVLTLAIAADLLIVTRPLLTSAPFSRSRVPYPQSIGRSSKIMQEYGPRPMASGSRASWISGYMNLFDLRFEAMTAAPMSPRRYDALLAAAGSRVDLLRAISVEYVVAPASMKLHPIARSENVVVSRVPDALPMAYVVTPGGERKPPRALALDASSARVLVDSASGGTLVVTQNDEPAWRVTIDGRAAPKKVALGAFRAVDITPGKHEIVWRYRPLSLVVGAWITMLALVAIAVARVRAMMLSR
jgi:hypothetical protein